MTFGNKSYARKRLEDAVLSKTNKITEKEVLKQVVQFIKLQYPNLIYRIDIAADVKLSIGQAKANKALQMKERGYPDIFIAKASKGFHGLYIELKKDKSEVFLKDGVTFKKRMNKKTGKCHIQEQHEMHERLRAEGYQVLWGFGFDDAINKIKDYLEC